MQKHLRAIMLSVIVITSFSGKTSAQSNLEDQIKECESTLQAADLAISRCEELHKAQREVIRAQQDQLLQAMKRARELEDEKDSLWRNPLLWGLAGVFLGATAAVLGGAALR